MDISKLLEIYNGLEHSHNIEISKYLKNNPSEEQFSSNFVSLIFEDGQFDFMSDNLDSVLKWYKAIKNLKALNRSKKNRYKHKNKVKQFENEIKQLTSNIWEAILNKKCGIDEITLLDTTNFKTKLAGEIKDYKYEDYFDFKTENGISFNKIGETGRNRLKTVDRKFLVCLKRVIFRDQGEDICYKERENIRVGKGFPTEFLISYLSP